MEKDIINQLWEAGNNDPNAREAIAQIIADSSEKVGGYSIPTRKKSDITGELEDLTINVMNIEDPEKRKIAIASLKQIRELTVRDLSIVLNILHSVLSVKEAKGETLTPEERTLKDLDINALAYSLRLIRLPKEAYQTYKTGADFDRARQKILDEINKRGA